MANAKGLAVNIRTELLAVHEGVAAVAVYIDEKFSRIMTFEIEEEK
ncbi:hypothetical protein [Paenibacillus sp.]|nr:hypothetical protein [Paenibacillus sp.]